MGRVRVLSATAGKFDVSLRPSRMKEKTIEPDPVPKVGSVVKGFVVSTTKSGCFVRISRSITARVMLKDLADTYVADPSLEFPTSKLVAGKVISVKNEAVTLSLKPSVVVGEGKHITYETLRAGVELDGGRQGCQGLWGLHSAGRE